MEIVFILLPLSLLLAIAGLLGYLWSVRTGQFDDLDGASMRPLIPEDRKDSKG